MYLQCTISVLEHVSVPNEFTAVHVTVEPLRLLVATKVVVGPWDTLLFTVHVYFTAGIPVAEQFRFTLSPSLTVWILDPQLASFRSV